VVLETPKILACNKLKTTIDHHSGIYTSIKQTDYLVFVLAALIKPCSYVD